MLILAYSSSSLAAAVGPDVPPLAVLSPCLSVSAAIYRPDLYYPREAADSTLTWDVLFESSSSSLSSASVSFLTSGISFIFVVLRPARLLNPSLSRELLLTLFFFLKSVCFIFLPSNRLLYYALFSVMLYMGKFIFLLSDTKSFSTHFSLIAFALTFSWRMSYLLSIFSI